MKDNGFVEDYEFNNPLIQKVDSSFDISLGDCHNNFYRTVDHICEYDFQLTIIGNIQMINLTISDKGMASYE